MAYARTELAGKRRDERQERHMLLDSPSAGARKFPMSKRIQDRFSGCALDPLHQTLSAGP